MPKPAFSSELQQTVQYRYSLYALLFQESEEAHSEFVENILGCTMPLSAGTQKEAFQALIEETFGDEVEYEVVKNIHENLTEMIEEHKEIPEPLTLDKHQVKSLFEKSGVKEEKLTDFDKLYDAAAGRYLSLCKQCGKCPSGVKTPIFVVIKIESRNVRIWCPLQIDGKRFVLS